MTLNDDDSYAVDAALKYIYTCGFTVRFCCIKICLRAFRLAEKYLPESLKELAAEKLPEWPVDKWSGLDFAIAISEIYAHRPQNSDTLKEIVVAIDKHN